jgi:hypothetical protein
MDRIHGAPLGGYGAPPEGYGAHHGMGAYTMEWVHGRMDRSHGQEPWHWTWIGVMDTSHGH